MKLFQKLHNSKIKISTLILIVMFFFNEDVNSQQSEFRFQMNGGSNLLITEAKKVDEGSYHIYSGFSFRRKILPNIYSQVGLGYNQRFQNTFMSTYYDKMFDEQIFFQTKFTQNEIIFPVALIYSYNKWEFDAFCNFKFLVNSNLDMNPIGTYKTRVGDIQAKYYTKNNKSRAQFTPVNYALGANIKYKIVKKVLLFFSFSYDLEVNPRYSYINKYNTIYNSIGAEISIFTNQ